MMDDCTNLGSSLIQYHPTPPRFDAGNSILYSWEAYASTPSFPINSIEKVVSFISIHFKTY